MTTIVTRAGKGAPLTNVEVDANFTNLNNDKLEKSGGTITANSNDPALKITQTGTGNALVVEDAASDTTPFVIAADGAVGIGTASPEFGGLTVAKVGDYSLVLKGDDYVTAQIRSYRESSSDHAQLNAFAARGTESAPTILASGDRVLTIKSHGWDGAAWVRAAEIRADIDNTPAAGSMPGRLTFSTTPSGSATPVERMRINSAGNLGLGVTPSDWSGYRALDVGSYATLANSGTTADILNNLYNDGAWKLKNTNPASLFRQSAGQFLWYGAPSGTAGTTPTLTQVLAVEKDKSLALQGATSQTGAGISFPATQVASSNANTLDDYEEGTFTPTVIGTSTSGTGTYTYQNGRYTKIGNRVFFSLSVAWTAHTGTGNIRITAIPFTSATKTNNWDVYVTASENLTYTGDLIAYSVSNSTFIDISSRSSGAAGSPIAMDTSAALFISGHYEV